ncbi:hypothetical protein BDV06DRAFT_213617 [Aspergillus oleicola]
MSALAPKHQQYLSMADDPPSADTKSVRAANENVTEIVRFLQTHVASQSQAPAQSTGPKDMIKAGQRRLRLALRTNKKGPATKDKVDDASRQLAALQNQGSFPRSQYRKWGHKRVPSITSSSKSVSDLSFKSNSKRDVEEIGRPWLEHPLEKRDAPGSKGSSELSSLDLRDLASFVEAAVNFSQTDDVNASAYQLWTEQNGKMPENAMFNASSAAASGSNTNATSRKTSTELPPASRFNPPAQSKTLSDTQNSSTSSKSSSAPTTPVLKLFPDTMLPRTSSRNAVRTTTVRCPTPSRAFSPLPGSQSTPALASVFESDNREYRNSSSSLPKIREDAPPNREKQQTMTERESPSAHAIRSLEPVDAPFKHNTRPSSLPPGAIYAFPLPAPDRPLPSAPEPLRIQGNSDKKSSSVLPLAHVQARHHVPETPRSMPPDISVSSPSSSGGSSPEMINGATRGRDSPFPRLVTSHQDLPTGHDTSNGSPVPIQPRRGSLSKTGRTREAKVRSLIMRDIATSRHQRNSSKDQVVETQPPQDLRESEVPMRHKSKRPQLKPPQQYQRKTSPGPSSPPPTSPPPSAPFQQAMHNRRYCTPPASTMAAAIENFENLSRSTPNGDRPVHRKKSSQKIEMKPERQHVERNSPDLDETPLPSSDDEGPTGDFYWNPSGRSSRQRRQRTPASNVVNKPTSERGRSTKKRHAIGSMEPQKSYRKRGLEKAPQIHLLPNEDQPYQHHAYHAPEPKMSPSLEGRIEHLERQNKILQAALLAALDVGVKQDLSSLLVATPPLTGTSFSSTSNTAISEVPSMEHDKRTRNGRTTYRPESWIASPDSFDKGSFVSDGGRELEEMMDEFDLDCSPQIPQHVSALLSHLTSRPGVQSTLILSRKDGSIIQTTGLLAPSSPKRTRSETSSPAPVAPAPAPAEETGPDAVPTTTEATPASPTSTEATTQTQQPSIAAASIPLPTSPSSQQPQHPQQPSKPYQPTQAESLAAHIFAFVSSASSLSFALSHPLGDGENTSSNTNGIYGPSTPRIGNGSATGTGGAGGDGEGDGFEGQDDDEVKLLRLRTKKHEIVVVPDRKYLLCVVQDGTGAAAGAPGAGLATGRLR